MLFRHGRFKRSNSVTTAVQADMELEGFPSMEDKGLQFGGAFGRHSEPSTPTQYGAIRTVRTQGLFSYREDYRPSSGPSSPQPEPWLVEPSLESTDTGRVSPLRRDGSWFMQLLHNETKRLEGWCKEMEGEAEEHDMTEESEYPAREGKRQGWGLHLLAVRDPLIVRPTLPCDRPSFADCTRMPMTIDDDD